MPSHSGKEEHVTDGRTEADIFGRTIVIVIAGGCLQDVLNVPAGYSYHLRDLDNEAGRVVHADDDRHWECPACGYTNTAPVGTHVPCGNCGLDYEVRDE